MYSVYYVYACRTVANLFFRPSPATTPWRNPSATSPAPPPDPRVYIFIYFTPDRETLLISCAEHDRRNRIAAPPPPPPAVIAARTAATNGVRRSGPPMAGVTLWWKSYPKLFFILACTLHKNKLIIKNFWLISK